MQDDKNKLICKICNQECSNYKALSNHITKKHQIETKTYYDQYIKAETEGFCKLCNMPTMYKNLQFGYRIYCSNSCSRKDPTIYDKAKATNLIKYGCTCSLANNEIKDKIFKTKLERHGDGYYSNKQKSKDTYIIKTLSKYQSDITDCKILNYDGIEFKCTCNNCNNEFVINQSLAYLRHYRYNIPLCTICNPIFNGVSQVENYLYDFIEGILKNNMINKNKLTCKICNQEFSKADCVGRHVKKMHNMEMKTYYDQYFKTEDEGICKCCGNLTEYYNLPNGYREFCSRRCFWKFTNNQDSTKEKRKATCIEKYGVSNYMQTDDFKKKSEETNMLLYGVKNAGGSTAAVEKIKQTKLERYGDENYNNNDKIAKELETLNKFKELCKDVDIINYTDKTFICKCKTCNNEFNIGYQTLCNRLYVYKTPICIYCNQITSNTSIEEQNLRESIIDETIIHNDRTILNGSELDIYLPDHKLAIEFDGLYWHNELNKSNNYHVNKTNECEKQGIQLIHVFEDEWVYKQDIVKSRISGLLGKNERIFARKCKIMPVSYNDSVKFLNENHIQGNCVSKYRYGLYYNDELVSIMTFGKSRFKDEFELLRFCNKLNTNVVGGASRLFKHFMKVHSEIDKVVSYADRRWSRGNVYEKLGFVYDSVTPPAYYYIVDGIRHNRVEFQKHKLVRLGYDSNMTEHEIMLERKIYRIYDCGNLKYIYTR